MFTTEEKEDHQKKKEKKKKRLTRHEPAWLRFIVAAELPPPSVLLRTTAGRRERVERVLNRVDASDHGRGARDVLLRERADAVRHQDRVVLAAAPVPDLVLGLTLALVLVVPDRLFRERVQDVPLVLSRLTVDPLFQVRAHLALDRRLVVVKVRVVERRENCGGFVQNSSAFRHPQPERTVSFYRLTV